MGTPVVPPLRRYERDKRNDSCLGNIAGDHPGFADLFFFALFFDDQRPESLYQLRNRVQMSARASIN
jgi:hypothetical protein